MLGMDWQGISTHASRVDERGPHAALEKKGKDQHLTWMDEGIENSLH